MVKVTIELTDEQMEQFTNEDEIKGMVLNYANHQIEESYNEEFKKLSLDDKKKKVNIENKKEKLLKTVNEEKDI
jgi:hypothetical protein